MATTTISIAAGLELVVRDGFTEDPVTRDLIAHLTELVDRTAAIKEIKFDVATLAHANDQRGLGRVLEAMGYACLHRRTEALTDRAILSLLDLIDDAAMIFVRTIAEHEANRVRAQRGELDEEVEWTELADNVQ